MRLESPSPSGTSRKHELTLLYPRAGRLESLINFQSLTTSLTGLDIANASLLDEGTAAAEGMIMAFGQLREKRKTIFVDRSVLPQTVAVLRTRAEPFGIKVVVGNVRKLISDEHGDKDQHKDLIGVLVQVRRAPLSLFYPQRELEPRTNS